MIWLAGEPCNCSALRTNESTMTTRVKQVINSRIEGASDSSVRKNRILMPMSTFCVPLLPPREMETGPKPVVRLVCAEAVSAPKTNSSRQTTSCTDLLCACFHLPLRTCVNACANDGAGEFPAVESGSSSAGGRQMAQQIHAAGRGSDQKSFLLIADHVNRMAAAQGTGFQDV